jgi:hypothetical protein
MSVTDEQRSRLGQIDLVIATPCYGGVVTANFSTAMLGTVMRLQPLLRRISIAMIANESLVTRARNTLVSQFMANPQTTHLMFIDADIEWNPDAVLSLLLADKPVVGGAYPLKTLNWNAMTQAVKRGGGAAELKSWSSVYVVNFVGGQPPPEPGDLVAVQDIGTGFLLIERSVLERMSAALPELRYRNTPAVQSERGVPEWGYALFDTMIEPSTGFYLSEDYAFCRRWQAMGGDIWLDRRIQLNHIGTHRFDGNPEAIWRFMKS